MKQYKNFLKVLLLLLVLFYIFSVKKIAAQSCYCGGTYCFAECTFCSPYPQNQYSAYRYLGPHGGCTDGMMCHYGPGGGMNIANCESLTWETDILCGSCTDGYYWDANQAIDLNYFDSWMCLDYNMCAGGGEPGCYPRQERGCGANGCQDDMQYFSQWCPSGTTYWCDSPVSPRICSCESGIGLRRIEYNDSSSLGGLSSYSYRRSDVSLDGSNRGVVNYESHFEPSDDGTCDGETSQRRMSWGGLIYDQTDNYNPGRGWIYLTAGNYIFRSTGCRTGGYWLDWPNNSCRAYGQVDDRLLINGVWLWGGSSSWVGYGGDNGNFCSSGMASHQGSITIISDGWYIFQFDQLYWPETKFWVDYSINGGATWNYITAAMLRSCNPGSSPTPMPTKTCNISAPATATCGIPFTVSWNGQGNPGETNQVRAFLERQDGGRLPTPIAYPSYLFPSPTPAFYSYNLGFCNSINGVSCTDSEPVGGIIPPGNYWVHCDVPGNVNQCSGNPMCVFLGWACTWPTCAGTGYDSITVSAPVQPTPGGVTVTHSCNYTSARANISWSPAPGATSYRVLVDGVANPTIYPNSPASNLPVACGVHTFRVRALNACGSTGTSAAVSAGVCPTPGTPANPTVTVNCSSVDVNWATVPLAAYYQVRKDLVAQPTVVAPTQTVAQICGTASNYAVRAISACRANSPYSGNTAGPVAVCTPIPPIQYHGGLPD